MVGVDIDISHDDSDSIFDPKEDGNKNRFGWFRNRFYSGFAVTPKTQLKASFALTDDAVRSNGPVGANHVT